jgi:hypothetical protein
MKPYRQQILILFLIGLGIAALIFLTQTNYRYAQQNPGGSDFMPRWVGTRLFLMEGKSPYSEDATREIQQRLYGRPAHSDEDQSLFAYPLHVMLIFAPFALIPDYDMARAAWMTLLEVAIVVLVFVSLSLVRWRIRPWLLLLLLLFGALWYYSIRALINANVGPLIALLVAFAFLAIRSERDGVAGFLLAMATAKPQMVVVLIVFVMIWALTCRRYVLFWSIIGNTVLLAAIGMLFLPNWIWQNLVQMVTYYNFGSNSIMPTTPGAIFKLWVPGVGERLGQIISVTMIVMLLVEWWLARGKEFRWFLWTACLTIAAAQFIGIPTQTENYLIMFPAVVLIFAAWDEQWGGLGRFLIFLSALLLFFGVWWLFLTTIIQDTRPIQWPGMFFPLPLFLLIGLYWVRWWVLRPEQPVLERLQYYRQLGSRNRR